MFDFGAAKSLLAKRSVRYSIAVVTVAAALLLRGALVHFLGEALPPFVFCYPAIMIVAVFCGLWPGVLATGMAALAVDYWVLPPHGSFTIANAADAIVLALFAGMGIFMSAVAAAFRSNQQKVINFEREQVLREGQEKLEQVSVQHRLALEAAQLGAWDYRFESGEVLWDERCRNLFGVSEGDQFDYNACIARIHPDDRPAVDEAVKQAIAGVNDGVYLREFRVVWADGSIHWVASHGRAQFAGEGEQCRATRFIGINLDITARKQAEETRARLAAIIDTSGDAIISKGLDGIVLSWNRSAERLFGYSAQEIIGQPINLIIPPDRQDEEAAFLERLRHRDSIDHYETVRLSKDGRKVDVSVTLSPICDAAGNVTGISKSVRDITERKQAEEMVRQSLERLEKVLEVETVGVMFWDLNTGCMIDANDTFLKLMGYSRSQVEAHELNWQKLTPPEYLDVSRAEVEKFLATGRVGPYEKEYFCKDGTRRWLLFAGSSLGNNQCVEFCVDIADRKNAEEALRQSEEKFRTLIEQASDAFFLHDGDGRFLEVNRQACESLGYTREELLRMHVFDVEQGVDVRTAKQAWEQGEPGKAYTQQGHQKRKDGTAFPVEVRLSAYYLGGQKLHLGLVRDITERKQAEEALRESEERWATTLQSIGDAVISTDASGNIQFMNDVAQRLTGWSIAEARDKDLETVFDIVQEVSRIKPENPVAKVLRSGNVVGLANHTALIRRDGTEVPIEDSAAPIRNRNGQVDGVVLVFHDVVEQRNTEKALRVSDRLATTGRLAATIAHEIHNPLDAIANLLYLIDQNTHEEDTRELACMASRELVRVTQMTRRMLTFQREAAKPIAVEIREILGTVVELYERKIKSAEIEIVQQLELDNHILALPGELRQMFANLVGNAIEAVTPQSGKITLRAYASRDWRNQRPGVRVVVADNGPGIPVDVRAKIFEPFFTTKGESGTGLGLWIASDILRKYDGIMKLRTSTDPNYSGTCFSIFLPAEANPD